VDFFIVGVGNVKWTSLVDLIFAVTLLVICRAVSTENTDRT